MKEEQSRKQDRLGWRWNNREGHLQRHLWTFEEKWKFVENNQLQKDKLLTTQRKEAGPLLKSFKRKFRTTLHFPMILFGSLNMLPLLSLYVGVLMSSDPSPACTHPPCRESLVAAPILPGNGAGVDSGGCEGPTGATTCRIGFSLPAISDDPRKVEHRHDKVSDITHSVTYCTL